MGPYLNDLLGIFVGVTGGGGGTLPVIMFDIMKWLFKFLFILCFWFKLVNTPDINMLKVHKNAQYKVLVYLSLNIMLVIVFYIMRF